MRAGLDMHSKVTITSTTVLQAKRTRSRPYSHSWWVWWMEKLPSVFNLYHNTPPGDKLGLWQRKIYSKLFCWDHNFFHIMICWDHNFFHIMISTSILWFQHPYYDFNIHIMISTSNFSKLWSQQQISPNYDLNSVCVRTNTIFFKTKTKTYYFSHLHSLEFHLFFALIVPFGWMGWDMLWVLVSPPL